MIRTQELTQAQLADLLDNFRNRQADSTPLDLGLLAECATRLRGSQPSSHTAAASEEEVQRFIDTACAVSSDNRHEFGQFVGATFSRAALERLFYELRRAEPTLARRDEATRSHDFAETVGKMLDAVGYTEAYAKQWPSENASITFKRWFDEQITRARSPSTTAPEQKITGLIAEIRAAKTMARRDFLFEEIIRVWEEEAIPIPPAGASNHADAPSEHRADQAAGALPKS